MAKAVASMQGLRDLEQIIEAGDVDFGSAQRFLTAVRDLKVRRSALVMKCGLKLINSKRVSAEELYLVHEHVCIAALDIQDMETALKSIKVLNAKFPDSVRVGRLRGMALEAQGKWKEASAVFDVLLEKNPTNGPILKRKIAMERSQGNFKVAIERMNEYLGVFMADGEAWSELADMYTEVEMYAQAAFCVEELIVAAPHNYLNHLRYAEIRYTMGCPEDLRIARKYFAAAVELTSGNDLRALYGLHVCCDALDSIKSKDKEPEDESELLELAGKNLVALYKNKCPEKLPLVQKMVA